MLGPRATLPRMVCFALLIFAAACSSTGRTNVETAKTQSISPDATASIFVKFTMSRPHPYQIQIEKRLRKELAENLVTSGIFKSVSNNAKDADYRIDVQITRIRIRSTGARIMFGFFAGRSFIAAEIQLHQTKPEQLVTAFRTTGYGARTAIGAQSYGYDDPVREVVSHVIHNLQ